MGRAMLAERVKLLNPSPTLALTAKVRELRGRGEDVMSFAAGEPDFDTPEPVCEAAIQAIRDGFTKYTPTPGIPELREAISEKLARDNRVAAGPNQIVVSCGAKHAVFNALMALCDPGDEVILFSPGWMTYWDQVLLTGAKPVTVQLSDESGFVPTHDEVRAKVTDRTKAIIVNSPANPTGAVFPRRTIKEIAALALRFDFYVISDEIYEKHVYDGAEHVSIASLGSEIAARTVTISGVSKSHAMTGWRIGYSAAPTKIAEAISAVQDQVTSNASSISQKAALAALQMPEDLIKQMVMQFAERRLLMLHEMEGIPGVRCRKPEGAFYVFPDFSTLLGGRVKDDCELAQFLLQEHKVACVPGSVFGGAGHLRLTYAATRDNIVEGMRRIAEGVRLLT